MTHTPGFEEQCQRSVQCNPSQSESWRVPENSYSGSHLSARHGSGLFKLRNSSCGYIVQRVSGKPFEQYIAENIFKPLNMGHSTFVQPLPAELAPLMSSGYRLASDDAQPFEVVTPFPAGSFE
jgi:hypothetical protein